jgi:hypothetical protein
MSYVHLVQVVHTQSTFAHTILFTMLMYVMWLLMEFSRDYGILA